VNHILEKAQQFVADHISRQLGDDFVYHNLSHTERVVAEAYAMARHYSVQGHEFDSLLLACWFHDSGHSPEPFGHEIIGMEIMRSFLALEDIEGFDAELAESLIMATIVDEEPTTLLEEIIKDADLHYLGLDDYSEKAELLRKEWEIVQDRKLSNSEWYNVNLQFFGSHRFYTDYAQKTYGPQKDQNRLEIEQKLGDTQ
jgi:HD superfamily phosphodiesterase